MKANLKMENLAEKDTSSGLISPDWTIKENSKTESFMGQELYKIWMVFFKVNSKKDTYMEKWLQTFNLETDILANTKSHRWLDMDHINSVMGQK